MPIQQKALLVPAKGAAFELGTVDVPEPGAGQVLIKVEATGLNPADWFIQESGVYIKGYPAILGIDGAGVVAALGEGVTEFVTGDRVAFAPTGFDGSSFGTHQQYSLALSNLVVKIPDGVSFDQAATIPTCLATAVTGLFNTHDLSSSAGLTPPWEEAGAGKYAGKPILALGGATSVGQFAIQFLRMAGFSPLITTASLRNSEYLKSLGATHVIDRTLTGPDFEAAVRKITTAPIEVVFDTVGGFSDDVRLMGYDILASGGTLVSVNPHDIDTAKKREDKRLVWMWGSFGTPGNRKVGESLFSCLPRILEEGIIKPTPVEYVRNGLAAIPQALARLKTGEVSACKLVVHPPETP